VRAPYLAGVLHGDGWCTPLTIGLRCKDEDFSQAFAEAVNGVFGLSVRSKRDERGYWLVRTSNKSGRFNDAKAYTPRDDAERAAWLRGLFDSEGNAQCLKLRTGQASYGRRIAFYSTEVDTLEKASRHLSALGIQHKQYQTKNSATHIGCKMVYELRVIRRESFCRFGVIVGSNIGRKRDALQRIATTFQDIAEYTRRAQLLGAAAKHRKTMTETLAAVVIGVRDLVETGIKPTQRNCRVIPGYNTIQKHVPQAQLVNLALCGN
jgi:LAGLIDADG-like domain